MKFRTEIEPLRHEGLIDHRRKIVMVGSCFTDEIGERMAHAGLDVSVNPLGTLFNPSSIAGEITRAVKGDERWGLFSDGTLWRTFRRHSSMSGTDRDELAARLNSDQTGTCRRLAEADLLIATFGSAMTFHHRASGEIVANCHKRPSGEFDLRRLTVDEITADWARLIASLRAINPRLKVILTISPVRHAGYGLVADRLSKSTLCLACHEICLAADGVIYYPSYELLTDDLRDYRFYADDLVHPSRAGVEYVWEHFGKSFFTPATREICRRWEKLTARTLHRYSSPEARIAMEEATDILVRETASATFPGDEEAARSIYTRFKNFQKRHNEI